MAPRKKSKGLPALVEEDQVDADVLLHNVSPVNAPLEVNASGDVVGRTTPAGGRGQRAKGVAQWSETERVVRRRCLKAFIE